MIAVCKECGKGFERQRSKREFCSKKCQFQHIQRKAWNANRRYKFDEDFFSEIDMDL